MKHLYMNPLLCTFLLGVIMPSIKTDDLFKRFISINTDCKGLNCNFNPDQYLKVPQIIRAHGYPSETHVIETSDGYLLTIFRIPGARNGKKGEQPVLLGHGLIGDSAPWVICDNNSLGKFLFYFVKYTLIYFCLFHPERGDL